MSIDHIPLEEQKRRRLAMEIYVESITPARNSPFLPPFETTPLVQTLKKLKAFFSFITSLTNSKYWQWMENAFSLFKPDFSAKEAAKAEIQTLAVSKMDIDSSFTIEKPGKKNKVRL